MAIPEAHKNDFETIINAAKDGQLALMECEDHAGEPVYVLCAVNFHPDSDEEYEMVPLARMFADNPYATLVPPTREVEAE